MSSPVDPEDYSFVAYGDPFSDEEDEQSRFRGLALGKRRTLPSAYEQRVLNEKGRPMRFHGAFTGGFSAGYFNSVGSKEGFKPKSFHSSRKNRERDSDGKLAQRPEDFMDDEDFGEFGIAPRRIRPTHEFDDTHVRDTLQIALGDQSVIPQAGSLLKGLIVATRGTLAERLLRRLGWKNADSITLYNEDDDKVENLNKTKTVSSTDADTFSREENNSSSSIMFAKISFAAKTNTFGLGYSPLDPEVAMGRRKANTHEQDNLWSDRHPEESISALLNRQQKIRSENEFILKSGLKRRGITGHAFGVGALEEEDADVYEQDRLAEYDWEIGGCESDEEDEEQAEIEAARLGRLSSTIKKKSKSNSTERSKIIDGWTAPSQNRESHKVNKSSALDALPGFRCSSGKQDDMKIHHTQVALPPGYIPVFNPRCILNANTNTNEDKNHHVKHDALSRTRLLQEDSVYEKLDYVQQLRLQAAAAGLPVPPLGSNPSPVGGQQSSQSENSNKLPACIPLSSSNPTTGLLKIFKNDSNKQARFEAYQVLIRRGFTHEDAYSRCSILLDLSNEEKEKEASSFQAIIKMNKPVTPSTHHTPINNVMSSEKVVVPPMSPATNAANTTPVSTTPSDPRDRLPLTNSLPLYKQQLISSKLALRFRSAGCMDISKELTEEEEKAQRAQVESLDTVEPRDHAVATESYGALTRRRLKWHPDRLLCKRVNIPNPYPDSTFVGCPDERRPRNPFRQLHRKHGKSRFSDSASSSNDFSIFDLLDVNRTTIDQQSNSLMSTPGEQQISSDSDTDSVSDMNESGITSSSVLHNLSFEPSESNGTNPQPRGKALFAALFQSLENQKTTEDTDKNVDMNYSLDRLPSNEDVSQNVTDKHEATSSVNRIVGPTLPQSGMDALTSDSNTPPMDLFKSIFASDEELSSSSLSEDDHDAADVDGDVDIDDGDKHREGSSAISSNVKQSNTVSLSNDQSGLFKGHSLFSHLFEPDGDMHAPLSGLTRITTQPRETVSKVDTPSQNNPNPDLLYGPDLPPNFSSTSQQINPTLSACDQGKLSTVPPSDILFVESHLVTHRSSSKHKKQKSSKKKHKSKNKKRRKKRARKKSTSSESDNDNSSSTSSVSS
ncbi:unnamed protein product [Trichobilharzia szidati]|nr:unnamed protein product [Trichobilharzia szidati]